MIYLILMVLLNAVVAVILKLFTRFRVDHLQAIIFNYWVCVGTGSFFLGHVPVGADSVQQEWFPLALLMGAGFILVFNLFAYCTKTGGITAATVANKLSLVIPVIFSIFLYGEQLSAVHLCGIVLAFPAVYLASASGAQQQEKVHLGWIVLLFLCSGLLDTAMKYAQQRYLPTQESQAVYTIHLFAVAGAIGTLILVFLLITGRQRFSLRNLAGGLVLGIPNYFSIYYLVRMLNSNFIKSSAMIPLSNIGVLFASSSFAILFFREPMNARRWLGLALSLVVIVLLALS
ncbi:MAG: DMT family transporter [Chitinophagaceae bacterium]|nr:DMT family transporter [Chitinophagaceae bacterium]